MAKDAIHNEVKNALVNDGWTVIDDPCDNIVAWKDQYIIAKRKHLKLLANGIDMGTKGTVNWTRESLYER